jgi:hypothetical protein
MDLNQLLHAHQMAVMGQAQTPDRARRAAYDDAIALLAGRIRKRRREGGADVRAGRFVTGEKIPAYRDR